MVTGRITVDAELLSRTDLRPGLPARRFCATDYHWFTATCSRIGISSRDTAAQWNILAKITAITGVSPCAVTDEHFDAARVAMSTAYARRGKPTAGKNVAAVFHRLRLTLFHAGRISTLRPPTVKPPVSVTGWDTAPTRFAETAQRYLEQVALSLRPNTVRHIDLDLRRFGTWLADTHPGVTGCTDLRREHIEAFKAWLSTHPTPRSGKPLNRVSIKDALINLHCFFTRIAEWGYPDAPTTTLMFPGDLPIVDKPLPRFLDDAAAAKLLRAARADPDTLSRLIVELLARTGIRRGELLALTADAVVQIGSAYWLQIPIGKLHNDRYIPLHPQLKQLLDDWITHHRPTGLRTNRLLLERNRPIGHHRITAALRRTADAAGIGNVTAHQLRHTLATQAVNRGMSLDAIAALLGHYAGDLVNRDLSGGRVAEAGQQAIEDLLPSDLALGVGVVALSFQGGTELDGGLEEGARLTDRLEVAVQTDWSGAVAVAEHAGVHLSSQFGHLRAFGVGGQGLWGVVEGLDLLGDCEVLVGDGAVGDARVHESHPHRSMSEKRSDRFQRHAAVDGLGSERVTQSMRADVSDPGRRGDLGDGPVDAVVPDALAVFEEQVAAAQAGWSVGEPLVEEVLQLRVQGNVAVVAQLAQRHVQPVGGADLHYRIDCEIEEFTFTQAGSGQEFDTEAHERVGVDAGGLQQFGESAVVNEAGQRLVAAGQIAGEHEHPGRHIVAVPFGEAFETGAQCAEVLGQAGLGECATAASRGAGGQVQLVGLDVGAAQISNATDLGGVDREPARELTQHAFDPHHRRGAQRQPRLGDVAGEGGGQPCRHRLPGGSPLGRAVPVGLARRGVELAEVEQGGLRAEQGGAQRLWAVAVGPMSADGCHQRFSPCLDRRLRQLLGSYSGHGGHLDQRRPLQAGHDPVEAELGRARTEPGVEGPVVVGGDLAEVGPAGHQVVGAGPDPSGHDQPADHAALLERQRALLRQRQSGPPVDADPDEEHAGHRGHRVRGEHTRRDQVGPVCGDHRLDVGAPHR